MKLIAPEEIKTPAQKLEGVWKMTYGQYNGPDGQFVLTDSLQIKILVGNRFAWWHPGAYSEIARASSGTYQYDGQFYTENIEYSTIPSLIGQSIKCNIKLEEGKWYHSGIPDGENTMEEVWERVE